MKLLMLFVDKCEDTEAIATLDTLKRAGHEVTSVSLMKREVIVPKYSKGYVTDSLIENINLSDFDGVVIPGGPGSFQIMPLIPQVDEIIKYFAKENKLVSAICAAPFLIGRLGLLKGRNFTVHPGFENEVIGGNYLRQQGVVTDGNYVTAKSMYYSIEFALAIDAYFNGEEHAKKVRLSCQGEGE